eukprot:CAMPEP_0172152982 /NCGR_PEP_ID=MMETSP1050-20130122/1164_1 /TAXON_ID=233186 /ORGANISM="Cryptomonas curvata, Strain CCAP979/52" /LENGTH=91 /DNA_ID=CAMNT_0012821413 /DNA_START=268 /DNA_END=540 /DNA_ORIENTATION=-
MICVFMSDEDLTPLSFQTNVDRHCEDIALLSMVIVFADPLQAGSSRPPSRLESTVLDQGKPLKIETNKLFFTASSRTQNAFAIVLAPQNTI